MSRFFVGLTDGFFKNPETDGPLTPEDVAESLESIRDEEGYMVPWSSQDELTQKLASKLF